jgi:hypothetical protein
MLAPRWSKISLVMVIVFLTSCSNTSGSVSQSAKDQVSQSSNDVASRNQSIVKQLNSVACTDEDLNIGESFCPSAKEMTKICLENGFQLNQPPGKVVSSRSIKELASSEVQKQYATRKELVAYDEMGLPRTGYSYGTENVTRKIRAWCIGSEYIVSI